jgi:zinc and cadmium transporter
MTVYSWLAIYCALILIASLCGGALPLLGRITHGRLQLYLSASAGVMLGASFFHVMPDAKELAGDYFGWWMSLAVIGLFGIERFIAPHSHEMDGNGHHHHHDHDHHDHHEHDHASVEAAKGLATTKDGKAAAPAIAGWMAVLGLTIHTFMNGLGLAGEVKVDMAKDAAHRHGLWGLVLPGIAMFLAIALHKPADALAISTVLSRKGVSRRRISLVQLGFALMVPVGAAVFLLVTYNESALSEAQQKWLQQFTGAALSFSAGTFLFIALSDLLPEVQFHRHDRVPLFLSLVAGVAFMGFIAVLEDHGREGPTPAAESATERQSDDHDAHSPHPGGAGGADEHDAHHAHHH